MVTLGFPFAYNDYINPYFWPLKPHLCIWALEIERRRVRVKVWASVREVWGLKSNSRIFFPTKILLPKKLVKVSETCKSLLKWLFDKLSCENQFWQTFLNSLNCMRLIFILTVKNIFLIESQRILIEIEWDLFHCDLEENTFIWTYVYFFEFWLNFHHLCMDLRLSGPCLSNSTVQATMKHIGMWYQVHILPIWKLKLSESFCKL